MERLAQDLPAAETAAAAPDDAVFPDERLNLMFVCAHPSIDAGIRTPQA